MAVNVQRQKWVALHVLHEILQAAKTRQGALALLRTLLATQMIRSPRHRRLNPPRWQGPSAFHSMWNQIFPRHWCLLSVWNCLKMFENVWLSTLRPAQVKDELIRAMKESNSSMRLDSLVLVRPGQLHFGSFAFRSDRSDILVKGFLKFLWPKGHHKSSQAITCYHEHSLHLQMCFAAVLLCKVQATLGKSKCTFCRISISFNFHLPWEEYQQLSNKPSDEIMHSAHGPWVSTSQPRLITGEAVWPQTAAMVAKDESAFSVPPFYIFLRVLCVVN